MLGQTRIAQQQEAYRANSNQLRTPLWKVALHFVQDTSTSVLSLALR